MRMCALQEVMWEKWCEGRKVMSVLEGREALEKIGGLSVRKYGRMWAVNGRLIDRRILHG